MLATRLRNLVIIGVSLSFLGTGALAQQEFSGFLDDYSQLVQQAPGTYTQEMDDVEDVMATYSAIMVDQPEIVIAADSKYSGLKPNDVKLIADSLRVVLIKELERGNFRLVSSPGPDTVYLRSALTNVFLKKKGRRLLGYTPVGLVAGVATSPFKDVMDKVLLQQAYFEAELLDSETGERLGAIVEMGGGRTKETSTSWDEFLADLQNLASRFSCRLDNSMLPTDERRDCLAEFPFPE